jgi:hypothetical protein
MARGRMLSATISESKKFGKVANNTNRLVYLMLLPWVDREGRYEADATLISHRVLMRCGVSEDEVEAALTDLHACGLVRLYSVRGKRVLEVIDFLKWNTPHWKEHDSMLPAPDEADPEPEPPTPVGASPTQEANVGPSTGQASAKQGATSAQGLAVREVKGSKGKGKEVTPSSAAPTRENPQAFVDTWNDNRGRLPSVQALNGKRRDAVARLAKEHDGEALALFRDATLAVAGDDYWVEHQYGFDNLMRPGRVLEKAEKYRAGGAQLGTARVRMLARADRWAAALPDDGGS